MRRGLWLVLVATLWQTGCATCRVESDQDCLRKAVLELHTNQIMDNLIRLDKGLPIVHVDYSQLTGQVTDSATAEGDFAQTVHHAMTLPLLITRELMNLWSGRLTASRQNQVSVIGQPVTANPEVYNAYLAYYAKPGRLMKTPEPPAPGEAILVRCAEACCDDLGCTGRSKGGWWCHPKPEMLYYWIPCAYKEDFRELCLYAVALRGQVQAVPDYFEATIFGVTAVEGEDKLNTDVTMTIVLDKPVPNAFGHLTATIKGRLYENEELVLQPIRTKETPAAQRRAPGRPSTISMTTRLRLSFRLGPKSRQVDASLDEAIQDLAKQTVRLRFDEFSPPIPTTSDLLQQIRNQLELIRLGQQLPRAQ